MNLAVKYRPTEFDEVCAQQSVIKILERQVEVQKYKNAYLFSGSSGCGKTTIARIFANKINKGLGNPIEIDAASNNGVDNVRSIIDNAGERSIDSEYKIYIIDECHMITTQAWNALLKTLEESPKYTIFMFCTTEYHKVPATIQNRCQQYFLSRVPNKDIFDRLKAICLNERIKYSPDGLSQLVKLSQGSMRQAITYLEKCRDYDQEISLQSVIDVFGDFSYDTYFDLVNAIIDKNLAKIITIIDDIYANGNDLRLFVDMFTDFVLDLMKYTVLSDIGLTNIPESCSGKLKYTVNVEDAAKYYNHLVDKLLSIKLAIKGDQNIKTTVEIMMLNI